MKKPLLAVISAVTLCACAGCADHISEIPGDGYVTVRQKKGPELAYSPESGVTIMINKGRAFKDLNKNGVLDPYEDWRLTAQQRAADLAGRMDKEQLCGLMLFSSHNEVRDTVISENQRKYLVEDCIRHILVTKVGSPYQAAKWSNDLQALAESLPLGIPVNNSSDPRNYTEADSEYNAGSGGEISHWPREIGLGATFDMNIIRRHGEIASREYRALGITTALSPQIDLDTDPRWRRFHGTFSESPELNKDIARTYTDAFQTSSGDAQIKDGWGYESVNAMVKHWPGGGAAEGGRDSHYDFGKYAVFPGGNFEMHMYPFTEGAFKLDGPTATASAIMPFYTVAWNIDPSGENVAQNFSRYIINDLLREKYGFQGVVCTDWGVTADCVDVGVHSGKPYGVEHMTVAQRSKRAVEVGVDQFGGCDNKKPLLEAYDLLCAENGDSWTRDRFEQSARRLLVNIFRVGLFENPYLDPHQSAAIVGCEEFCKEGYQAQLKSIIMLKNHCGVLPVAKGAKVYVPKRLSPASADFWGTSHKERKWGYLIDTALVGRYYTLVDTPDQADFAIVAVTSPEGNWGYDKKNHQYLPISLQYEDYVAADAREVSIAGGGPLEKSSNRSYRGKKEISYNRDDMVMVRETSKAMKGKPVIVAVLAERPFVPAEIEPYASAMLLSFGVSNQAIMDIVSGAAEPYGLLPAQLPASMRTVELQYEDTPFDMECYVDADGNSYDFAFGLDWNGVISDERTARYAVRDSCGRFLSCREACQ